MTTIIVSIIVGTMAIMGLLITPFLIDREPYDVDTSDAEWTQEISKMLEEKRNGDDC